MGVIKVIKSVVGGRRSEEVVAEPPSEMMSMDAMSWLFCIALSLSLCFVVALAFRSAGREIDVKEQTDVQKTSEQEDAPAVPTPEAGELEDKIIDTDTKSGDTDDETEADSKTTDEPPTPTRPPPKEEETNAKPAPSVSDMSLDDMSTVSSRSRKKISLKTSLSQRMGRFGVKNAYTAKLPSVYKTEY